jgi:hypothetical protein
MGDDASRLRWKSRPDCGSADPINGFEFESRLRAAFFFRTGPVWFASSMSGFGIWLTSMFLQMSFAPRAVVPFRSVFDPTDSGRVPEHALARIAKGDGFFLKSVTEQAYRRSHACITFNGAIVPVDGGSRYDQALS